MPLTHRELLELSTDRSLPPGALARAAALDAAAPPKPFTPPAPKRRFRSTDHLVATMAQLMVERMVVDGSCVERDLLTSGFSRHEIELWGEMAQVRAAVIIADKSGRRAS